MHLAYILLRCMSYSTKQWHCPIISVDVYSAFFLANFGPNGISVHLGCGIHHLSGLCGYGSSKKSALGGCSNATHGTIVSAGRNVQLGSHAQVVLLFGKGASYSLYAFDLNPITISIKQEEVDILSGTSLPSIYSVDPDVLQT